MGEPIEGSGATYALVRGIARCLVGVFYRRIEVTGLDRVPRAGPLIVAANHQNALVDPMMLLTAIPRRLVPISKATLFRHPLIGPFLWLVGAVPVHRRAESDGDPSRNAAAFARAAAHLAAGGALVIFPEGVSQERPVLQPLRTGTARMLLAAEAAGVAGVTLLPVGLVFDRPGTFRVGRTLVAVGEPVVTADCVETAGRDPETAARRLTERLAEGLRRQMVEAADFDTLRLVRILEHLVREAEGDGPADEAGRRAWMQMAMRGYRWLAAREPARVAAFRLAVETLADDLERAGLTGARLSRSYPRGTVARYAMHEGLALLAALPLAAWGLIVHALPYQATRLAVAWMRPAPDEEATYKMSAGLVLYPVAWAIEAVACRALLGAGGLAAFLGLLLPAGFLAIAWGDRVARVRRDVRGYLRFLLDRDLTERLRARRAALVTEFRDLAQRVPQEVRQG